MQQIQIGKIVVEIGHTCDRRGTLIQILERRKSEGRWIRASLMSGLKRWHVRRCRWTTVFVRRLVANVGREVRVLHFGNSFHGLEIEICRLVRILLQLVTSRRLITEIIMISRVILKGIFEIDVELNRTERKGEMQMSRNALLHNRLFSENPLLLLLLLLLPLRNSINMRKKGALPL